MRGKTVRQTPKRVNPEYVTIPRDFYELHKFVTLTADVMFINGFSMLVTLSRDIRLYIAEYTPTHTAKQLTASILKVARTYARGGLGISLPYWIEMKEKKYTQCTTIIL